MQFTNDDFVRLIIAKARLPKDDELLQAAILRAVVEMRFAVGQSIIDRLRRWMEMEPTFSPYRMLKAVEERIADDHLQDSRSARQLVHDILSQRSSSPDKANGASAAPAPDSKSPA